ncbi:tetraacyldisaccharide 4'-kinase [Nitritalea halalkaliphila LW7]|uniref:Tetraacyldisaccharide 4'-kinase n=1 Tax=Nitritalea halalkaliphila LW7 TaxID=1189621 RepID=I5C638_9BACT|nr:tetraacyldisaccharide 4'-kinase [Nitritalea halalkaliphila]EIM77290.1 tetraacyldisaccharide 4'-kinase [Nitritalea halalkaliphila LW7]
MKWYQILAFPFAQLYAGAMRFRHHLFETGLKKSVRFDRPCIAVGNLSVGGTGKTPAVDFLIEQLQERYAVAVVSRGYGRKTRGVRVAQSSSTAEELGDEPALLYEKHGGRVPVAVGERRIEAIPLLLAEHPETEVILLDDAFQHRYVERQVNLLLSTYAAPFFRDQVLPAGWLRESRSGAARASAILVTKCPENLGEREKETYRQACARYAPGVPVYFSTIRYGQPYPLGGSPKRELKPGDPVLLFSGLASDEALYAALSGSFQVRERIRFPDHVRYGASQIAQLRQAAAAHPGVAFICTEKDAIKLKAPAHAEFLAEFPIFAQPMAMHMSETDRDSLETHVFTRLQAFFQSPDAFR